MRYRTRRREFIILSSGAMAPPVIWRRAARAQQNRVRRIAVLIGASEHEPEWQGYVALFRAALANLGWVEGRNLRIDLRFGEGEADRTRTQAAELVGLAPDLIFTASAVATQAVRERTNAIPIVFVGVGNLDDSAPAPVRNIPRPEGNVTGFTNTYASLGGKLLELLKEVAPRVARFAVVVNPSTSVTGTRAGFFPSVEQAARVLGVKADPALLRDPVEFERAISAFAAEPDGGLILHPNVNYAAIDRELTLRLALQHRLPAISMFRSYPARGGLMSYGTDWADLFRGAANYIDRILRGAKPGELPVQFPTKFELVVNLKTAKAIGLTIPEAFLLRADEVIE